MDVPTAFRAIRACEIRAASRARRSSIEVGLGGSGTGEEIMGTECGGERGVLWIEGEGECLMPFVREGSRCEAGEGAMPLTLCSSGFLGLASSSPCSVDGCCFFFEVVRPFTFDGRSSSVAFAGADFSPFEMPSFSLSPFIFCPMLASFSANFFSFFFRFLI